MSLPSCPFCAKTAQKRTKFEGIFFCGRHGHFEWYDRARLSDLDLLKIYQSYSYNISIDQDYEKMRPKYLSGLSKRILRYFPKTEKLTFLDVGCANGEYLDCAKELGMTQIEGVEIDKKAVAKASRFGVIHTSLKEIQNTFHIVQCKNVLTNIENFQDFLSDMLRLVKSNGILFLDVLNQFGIVSHIKKNLGRPGVLRPPFVINGFSKNSIISLANRHSAKVVLLQTSYCGSDFLPYRKSLTLTLRGIFTKALGAATMILTDIKI